MEERKKETGMMILVICLILIIIGLVGYIYYDKGIITIPSKVEEKENSKKEEKEKEVIKELDITKCLNNSVVTYKNPSDKEPEIGLSMSINEDKKSITLTIDWDIFGKISEEKNQPKGIEEYEITGFKKEIQSTFVGELGQSAEGITLFYLMKDGTVEYTPMFILKENENGYKSYKVNYTYEYDDEDEITGGHFETNGTIFGVSNIIKLYNIDAYNENGWRTTIGAKADGSFYDLNPSNNQ